MCSKYPLWSNMRHLVVSSVVSLLWTHLCRALINWRCMCSGLDTYLQLISVLCTCESNLVCLLISWIVESGQQQYRKVYTTIYIKSFKAEKFHSITKIFLRNCIPYSCFFEVLKFCKGPIYNFFHEWVCQNGQLFGTIIFHVVKFHEWSTSTKFAEFMYLEKTNYMVCTKRVIRWERIHYKTIPLNIP